MQPETNPIAEFIEKLRDDMWASHGWISDPVACELSQFIWGHTIMGGDVRNRIVKAVAEVVDAGMGKSVYATSLDTFIEEHLDLIAKANLMAGRWRARGFKPQALVNGGVGQFADGDSEKRFGDALILAAGFPEGSETVDGNLHGERRDLDFLTLPGPSPSPNGPALKKSYRPIYDSFEVMPYDTSVNLWVVTVGHQIVDRCGLKRTRIKTRADSNLSLSNQLGLPNAAYWTWLKLSFEYWADVADIDRFMRGCLINVIFGQSTAVASVPCSLMEPTIPYGVYKARNRPLQALRWDPRLMYVAKIGPLFVESTTYIQCELVVDSLSLREGIQGKIVVGPTFYSSASV